MYRRMIFVALIGAALAIVFVSKASAAWSSIHVNRAAVLWNIHYPDTTWDPTFPQDGCDDYWSQWNSVPKTIVEPNGMSLNSYNLVTDLAAYAHNGFDGAYECTGGSCKVKLCSTDSWGADPWSIRLSPW